jgi:hypothetical protein
MARASVRVPRQQMVLVGCTRRTGSWRDSGVEQAARPPTTTVRGVTGRRRLLVRLGTLGRDVVLQFSELLIR